MTAIVRPKWDDTWMGMARGLGAHATCPRRSVGAFLVKDNRILGYGYNGAPTGQPHCADVGCLMVTINDRLSCRRALHAEVNAVVNCSVPSFQLQGSTLYVTAHPCDACAALLIQVGVKRVVWASEYPAAVAATVLTQAGVLLEKYDGG